MSDFINNPMVQYIFYTISLKLYDKILPCEFGIQKAKYYHLLFKALTVRKALILLVCAVFVPCVYLQARHVKITQSNPKLTRTIQTPAQETSH